MANTYLTVPFKDKDTAKSLGARWDAAQRQWFVPDGRELTPFSIGYVTVRCGNLRKAMAKVPFRELAW